MATPSEHDVDDLVRQILAEADSPQTPALDDLCARAAALCPANKVELLGQARRRNLPILASSPSTPPPPEIVERMRSAAGA